MAVKEVNAWDGRKENFIVEGFHRFNVLEDNVGANLLQHPMKKV